MKNEKMIKQLKYEARTEKGLVYINSLAGNSNLGLGIKSNNIVIDEVLNMIK